ncbi:SDR family NAD(P)-dependent oxidoreductase [Amycolatopsis pithecellobii]|uniref:SDR family NAD(P)-dependent oxidoreductase n=1 Tax=Amycolatopsis pithecellobii TaxID=664692 RepID=A0A6N7YLZ3_9PSEU|nr:SDR family oxidoreductase [Amycolatopsis pithecellobii]MTD53062.1 SDR family NAD(P)-dependent oxidoreductase [Amycolatopsis pithecellobii]
MTSATTPATSPSSSRTALITGGSAGIGLAIAQMLAEEGFDLTLVARDENKLGSAARGLVPLGARVATLSANLASPDVGTRAVESHLAEFGGLDVLVNNAGVGFVGPIADKSPKQLELELSLNFKAAYLTLQAAIPSLVKSAAAGGKSVVVNVSSLTAKENPPNGSAYAATKAALVSLSNVAHAELSRHGIHVTALLPGFVDTPGTSWAPGSIRDRMLTADDVAEAVRFLLRTSDRCFVPEIMMTTAGPSVWHSPIDWERAGDTT